MRHIVTSSIYLTFKWLKNKQFIFYFNRIQLIVIEKNWITCFVHWINNITAKPSQEDSIWNKHQFSLLYQFTVLSSCSDNTQLRITQSHELSKVKCAFLPVRSTRTQIISTLFFFFNFLYRNFYILLFCIDCSTRR